MSILNNYPGAKSNTGIIQFLVNEIPYHKRYFELFAGSAQLYKNKKEADCNYLNDCNYEIVKALEKQYQGRNVAIAGVDIYRFLNGAISYATRNDFIYLDPPYLKTARRSGAKYYDHEMMADADHVKLIMAIQALNANIMISTKEFPVPHSCKTLYDIHLKGWRKKCFETMDRRGKCTEVIYMNYDTPKLLHQYDMLGDDYVERQHIKRKVSRFTKKIQMLPEHQKHLLIQLLINNDAAAVQHFLAVGDIK